MLTNPVCVASSVFFWVSYLIDLLREVFSILRRTVGK